jgi:hypothetical protein
VIRHDPEKRAQHQLADSYRLGPFQSPLEPEALRSNEVQLVVLNDASPLLRHRALRDGRLVIEREARARVQLEARTIIEYLDTAPLRAVVADGIRRRIAEGRFGRP